MCMLLFLNVTAVCQDGQFMFCCNALLSELLSVGVMLRVWFFAACLVSYGDLLIKILAIQYTSMKIK